jgi:hypothetical protein
VVQRQNNCQPFKYHEELYTHQLPSVINSIDPLPQYIPSKEKLAVFYCVVLCTNNRTPIVPARGHCIHYTGTASIYKRGVPGSTNVADTFSALSAVKQLYAHKPRFFIIKNLDLPAMTLLTTVSRSRFTKSYLFISKPEP